MTRSHSPQPASPPADLVFCLGGHDLEMVTIADLVREVLGPDHLRDRGARWGARATLYADDIATIKVAGRTPVLVELGLDGAEDLIDGCLVVDHHGALAGADAPTALEQVFGLLRLPASRWTRHLALVAANDRGHVQAMREAGATNAEVAALRAADRTAQGVTDREVMAARHALRAAQWALEGQVLVVSLDHDRASVVADLLAAGPDGAPPPNPPPDILLVCGPTETNAYGPGWAVAALDRASPGGWSGGSLPARGFWGYPAPLPVSRLLEVLAAGRPEAGQNGNPVEESHGID